MESLKELAFMISESGKLPVVYNEETRSFEVVTPSVVFDSPTKNGATLYLEENDGDLQVATILQSIHCTLLSCRIFQCFFIG